MSLAIGSLYESASHVVDGSTLTSISPRDSRTALSMCLSDWRLLDLVRERTSRGSSRSCSPSRSSDLEGLARRTADRGATANDDVALASTRGVAHVQAYEVAPEVPVRKKPVPPR